MWRAGAYNNAGTSDDTTSYAGNFDDTGNSYSLQGLQSHGLIAGQNTTVNGISFTWPNVTPGLDNNYQASGQIIPVMPVANATTIGFLGATSGIPNGPLSGTATITYTDSSTQTFTLGFEDWCSNTISSLPNGSSVVATRTVSCGIGQMACALSDIVLLLWVFLRPFFFRFFASLFLYRPMLGVSPVVYSEAI